MITAKLAKYLRGLLILAPLCVGSCFDSLGQSNLTNLTNLTNFANFANFTNLMSTADWAPSPRTDCGVCHSGTNQPMPGVADFLKDRAKLSREEWAQKILLSARCGSCHLVPEPSNLQQSSWREAVSAMLKVMDERKIPRPTSEELTDVVHFYYTFSPKQFPRLPPDPLPAESPLVFKRQVLGRGIDTNSPARPAVGNLLVTDLDKDGRPDVLVCDMGRSQLTWIHQTNGLWLEELLAAQLPCPANAQVVDANGDGSWDIVVACLGVGGMRASDDLNGMVFLLMNDGKGHFTPRPIMSGLCRASDAQPGDFNGDGRIDFVVGEFGFIVHGGIGWLEQGPNQTFEPHLIWNKPGAVNVTPIDINGDSRLDFIALVAQDSEEIIAFINDGHGEFQSHLLWKAPSPVWGSSRIQLVDLNHDGKMDILYSNGDNADLKTFVPRPYHGVAWLENKGDLKFEYHDLGRFYGAYSVVAGDLDGDGDLDLVVSTLFSDCRDPNRASLLWLENDGKQNFTRHTIATEPIHLITAVVGDVNQDGRLDILASSMNVFPPFERMGRVTLWENLGRRR